MKKQIVFFLALWFALLALPFFLHSGNGGGIFAPSADTLVVITAHNKTIRDEYQRGFSEYYRKLRGRDVVIDFRSPGGTSDIVRYIADRFEAEFRDYVRADPARGNWSDLAARSFSDPRATGEGAKFRKLFLGSDVGIGIDVMAGGGIFDQARQAERGFAVPGGVEVRHPEYFRHIPQKFGGSDVYDKEGRYYSVVLSTFGIVCNLDRIRDQKIPLPQTWRDLGQGVFFGALAVGNPAKSGSVTKCFEIMIQQCMNDAPAPDAGWANGLNLIKRIFANSRLVSDSAGAIVRDVGIGNSVCGIAIDSYGIGEREYQKTLFDGKTHLAYLTPRGGTAVSGDPVQILRGAPHRRVAEDFLDYLLSPEGQKLHCYRVGTPDGPRAYPINRPPVRRDLYDENYQKYAFDCNYNPYVSGEDFVYRPERTGRYYTLIRQTVKILMIDCHAELISAWRAILAAGGPEKVPQAFSAFNALPYSYAEADEAAKSISLRSGRSAAQVAATMRKWSDFARAHYRLAEKLAGEGR